MFFGGFSFLDKLIIIIARWSIRFDYRWIFYLNTKFDENIDQSYESSWKRLNDNFIYDI